MAGGDDNDGNVLSSAELYDPVTHTWTATGPLANPRQFHTATLLLNGQVLVAGGWGTNDTILSSAELYDPGNRDVDRNRPADHRPRIVHGDIAGQWPGVDRRSALTAASIFPARRL